jgi:iron(III) transport system ATP-binding protein
MVSISIRQLHKAFGSNPVLNDVNLDIEAGELFFLLGPSGCGKTTLLRHLAGFCQPDSGLIFFNDEDITRLPAHQRNAAMMFQSYALWPHMDVKANVAFGLEEKNLAPREIETLVGEVLSLVRMREHANWKVNDLSGGQQQRVALARALVVRPHCLLLDEPLCNLDAQLRQEMRSEIRRICKVSGLTAIYVTHDQEEALCMADRLALIKDGGVLQVGTPQDVYRHPISVEAAALVGEVNTIEGTAREETGYSGVWRVQTECGIFRGRVADPSWQPRKGQQVHLCIRPEGFRLNDTSTAANSIEASIKGASYLGRIARYEVETPSGNHFVVAELNPHILRAPGKQSMRLECEQDDVIILRRA